MWTLVGARCQQYQWLWMRLACRVASVFGSFGQSSLSSRGRHRATYDAWEETANSCVRPKTLCRSLTCETCEWQETFRTSILTCHSSCPPSIGPTWSLCISGFVKFRVCVSPKVLLGPDRPFWQGRASMWKISCSLKLTLLSSRSLEARLLCPCLLAEMFTSHR